ncbi:MAG: hypothetical protein KF686_20210 [Ramlibacter sp.]|nr:hypothetical protein [Ramlibacter sp.]
MKAMLAKRLVADLMAWDDDRATQEFAWLELMVDYKFDHYQGYGAGHRFYIHLLQWLSSFKTVPDRECAYALLRRRLVYISQREMHHLVALSWSRIALEMHHAIARRLNIPVYQVASLPDARRQLAVMRERTLYVGVSDGARIDVFRRLNEGLVSNEQVVPMAEISESKKMSLCNKLQGRLAKLGSDGPATFEWVCLIDDFTGSGTSSIRLEDAKWDGKVHKFIKDNALQAKEPLIAESAHVLVHHYLASAWAADQVTDLLQQYQAHQEKLTFIPSFSHVLPPSIKIDATADPALEALLKGRYDPSIEDEHTKKDIWLGYKQCGLPLVLDHNAPNNTVATIWARSNPKKKDAYISANHMSPLFPRRQRHSDAR